MPRIRQVKPEYFSDPDVAALPMRTRLTYIGLWTIADDAGWLPRLDPAELGHALYGYESGRTRERWLVEDLVLLQESGQVHVLSCGHAVIPTLPLHQRATTGTRRVEMHLKEHESRCRTAELPGTPRSPRPSSVPATPPNHTNGPVSADISGTPRNSAAVGNGRELVGNGKSASAREAGDEDDEEANGLKSRLGAFEDVMRRAPDVGDLDAQWQKATH